MKILALPLFIVILIFASCNNQKKKAANEMAGEMCKAMELIKDDDPMSTIDAASAMTTIAENKEKYGDVNTADLIEAMKKICPEGAKKFVEITQDAKESSK